MENGSRVLYGSLGGLFIPWFHLNRKFFILSWVKCVVNSNDPFFVHTVNFCFPKFSFVSAG